MAPEPYVPPEKRMFVEKEVYTLNNFIRLLVCRQCSAAVLPEASFGHYEWHHRLDAALAAGQRARLGGERIEDGT